MINAILKYSFMQNAILAAILASIISGITGTVIVEKKMGSLAGGIAHASFGGVGIGYFIGVEPIYIAFVFSTIGSICVRWLKKIKAADENTITGMIWAGGMAIGILAIWLTPGYPPDMSSYLFGDILNVNRTYLILMAIVTPIILILTIAIFKYLKLYLFDENYAKIIKINTNILDIATYTIIAISVVMLIKIVGIVLSIAMLNIPSATSKCFSKSLRKRMIHSTLIALFDTLLGLTISYYINVPSGATIVMVSIIIYGIILFFNKKSVKN